MLTSMLIAKHAYHNLVSVKMCFYLFSDLIHCKASIFARSLLTMSKSLMSIAAGAQQNKVSLSVTFEIVCQVTTHYRYHNCTADMSAERCIDMSALSSYPALIHTLPMLLSKPQAVSGPLFVNCQSISAFTLCFTGCAYARMIPTSHALVP